MKKIETFNRKMMGVLFVSRKIKDFYARRPFRQGKKLKGLFRNSKLEEFFFFLINQNLKSGQVVIIGIICVYMNHPFTAPHFAFSISFQKI